MASTAGGSDGLGARPAAQGAAVPSPANVATPIVCQSVPPQALLLAATFTFTRANNIAMINQEASSDLELQLLLLGCIRAYKAEQEQAKAAGLTVSQRVIEKAEQQRKKRKVGVQEEVVEEISPTETVPRGKCAYAHWAKKLFERVLVYIDSDSMPKDFVKTLSVKVCKEIFEFGSYLLLHGDKLDQATETNVQKLFDLLKILYEVNGSLWVRIQWNGTEPVWAACGFYSVKKHSASGRIFVTCSLVKDPAEFTEAIYLKDPGPFEVVSQNFSLKSAHFKTALDTYVLMNLFPALSRRSLQRRMSEELGARTPQGPKAGDAPDAAAPSVPRPTNDVPPDEAAGP